MRATLVATFAALLACNSAPANTCTPPGNSLISSAQSPTTCTGSCVSVLDGGDPVCVVDCTDAGDSVCQPGAAGPTSCFAVPINSNRYCLPPCTADGGCTLSALTCAGDAGFCY